MNIIKSILFINLSLFSQLIAVEFVIYNTDNSMIPDNNVSRIAIDKNGNKWIGMESGDSALVIFNHNEWTPILTTPYWGIYDWVSSIIFDSNENIWVSTDGGGMTYFDSENKTVYNQSNSELPDDHVFDLELDNEGSLWISTEFAGLVKFDGQIWSFFNSSNSPLPDTSILDVEFDSNGIMWVATFNNGFAKYDNGTWHVFNSSNSILSDNNIFTLEIDSQNNVWLGSMTDGLIKITDGSLTKFNTNNSNIPHNWIRSIEVDDFDNIWLATNGGDLALLENDKNTFTLYQLPNIDWPANIINDITIDGLGNKWLGTNGGGLILFNEDEIKTSVLTTSKYVKNFHILQNYPNPFNSSTTIEYYVPFQSEVKVKLYNTNGNLVETIFTGIQNPGKHEINFLAKNLSSGLYLCRLEYVGQFTSRKIIFIK